MFKVAACAGKRCLLLLLLLLLGLLLWLLLHADELELLLKLPRFLLGLSHTSFARAQLLLQRRLLRRGRLRLRRLLHVRLRARASERGRGLCGRVLKHRFAVVGLLRRLVGAMANCT